MSISDNTNSWDAQLKSNGTFVKYKLDTGAQVNVIPFKTLSGLRIQPKIHHSQVQLTAYNGTSIPVQGQCTIDILHNHQHYQLPFIIAEADSPAILGLRSCDQMNLVARVMHMKQGDHSLFDLFFSNKE